MGVTCRTRHPTVESAERHDPTGPVVEGPGLSGPVLSVMEHEGLLRRVLDGVYLPVDCWELPAQRAAALATVLPWTHSNEPRADHPEADQVWKAGILICSSAAWVWGAPTPPQKVTAAYRRADLRPDHPRVQGRQCETLLDSDLVVLQGFSQGHRRQVMVTTPTRTALDLALSDDDDATLIWLLDTLVEADEVQRALDRQDRAAGLVRARARIRALQ